MLKREILSKGSWFYQHFQCFYSKPENNPVQHWDLWSKSPSRRLLSYNLWTIIHWNENIRCQIALVVKMVGKKKKSIIIVLDDWHFKCRIKANFRLGREIISQEVGKCWKIQCNCGPHVPLICCPINHIKCDKTHKRTNRFGPIQA